MKSNNIYELINKKSLIIPSVLLKYYKELKLDYSELLFVSYLLDGDNDIPFDVLKFSADLNIEVNELMNIISSLCEKNVINMIVKKDNNLMKEYLNIESLIKKITLLIIGEEEENIDDADDEIYSVIEQEFARPLSPIEYETIKRWRDSKISDQMIKEALKEAVLNGVTSLRYIEKILSEWKKKGYKKPSDITNKKKEEQIDVFDCDWLNENE